MNWQKLKSMDCPKCGAPLASNMLGYLCTKGDFQIGKKKFDEVVQSLYNPKRSRPMTEEESMEAWNNEGHEEQSESFLDEEIYD